MRAACLAFSAASAIAMAPAQADELRGREPGAFAVDGDAAAARALERTLVRAGALLLSPGQIEIEPFVRYARIEAASSVLVNGATPFVADVRRTRDIADTGLSLRVGLPFDAQAEVSLPLRGVQDRVVVAVNGAPGAESARTAGGFGDLAIGLTKTLLHEDGARPDLFAAFAWDSATGGGDGDIDFGSGFHEFTGSLTAVQRVDPLVLVATGRYQRTLSDDGVRPGDQYGVSLRAILATSPTTALRFGLDQTYVDRTRINGADAAGTDQLASSFVIGAAGAVSRHTLLDLELGVGLTDDAPRYTLQASAPLRIF